jgi:hypothetical protein
MPTIQSHIALHKRKVCFSRIKTHGSSIAQNVIAMQPRTHRKTVNLKWKFICGYKQDKGELQLGDRRRR